MKFRASEISSKQRENHWSYRELSRQDLPEQSPAWLSVLIGSHTGYFSPSSLDYFSSERTFCDNWLACASMAVPAWT